MKRILTGVMIAALLASMLCGCGNNMTEDGYPTDVRPSPTVSPDLVPDVDDGVVKDRDGIIEDGDAVHDGTGADRNTVGRGTVGGNSVIDGSTAESSGASKSSGTAPGNRTTGGTTAGTK